MKLRANVFAIAVASSLLCAPIAYGQDTIASRNPSQGVTDTFPPFQERLGVSQPLSQNEPQTKIAASPFKLSFQQSDDSSHSSRTHNVIIGALVGGAIGLGTGLLLDHTGKSGGSDSGEHITYTFEVYTIPIGIVIGAFTGLLIPSR